MKLQLGLGLSATARGAVSGSIPPVTPPGGGEPNPPGSFDGFQTPPTVEVVSDTVVIHGKVKPGFVGKFVVPLGTLIANQGYSINFVSDLSGLELGGSKAGFGFVFKTDTSFHMALLQGDGVGIDVAIVHGAPPHHWNKQTGHTVIDKGTPESGNQHGADLQLVTDSGGTAYSLSTSADEQDTWDEEYAAQAFTPFSNVSGVIQFGFGGRISNDDAGTFTVTVTWVEAQSYSLDFSQSQNSGYMVLLLI